MKLENDEEVLRPRNTPRRMKSILARTVIISMILFILLIMSVLYRSLVVEQIDEFKQIARLNRKHQNFNQPMDTVIEIPENELITIEQKESSEAIVAENKEMLNLEIQHGKLKFSRPRLSRELSELDPLLMLQRDLNLQRLKANLRSKREKIALSKLEKEYLHCKKMSRNSNNDCIAEFVKLYQVAKELNEKMEIMVEMFKDSEQLLQQQSSISDSNEDTTNITNPHNDDNKKKEASKEIDPEKATTEEQLMTKNEAEATTMAATTPTTAVLTTTTLTTTSTSPSTTTTTTTTLKPYKIKPIRISWIIDGNDDVEETTQRSTTQAATTQATSTTLQLTTEEWHANEDLIAEIDYQDDLTTKGPNNDKLGWILNVKGHDASENIRTPAATTASPITTDGPSPASTTQTSHVTTEKNTQMKHDFTTEGLSLSAATEKPPIFSSAESERERLRKLKFDWILDGEVPSEEATKNAVTATTTKSVTTRTYPTRPRKIKYDWIVDDDTNSAETLRTGAAKDDELLTKHFDGNKADFLRLPKPNNTHPLDYPTSLENLLGSFEKSEFLKPLKNQTEIQEEPRYDPIVWAKKFKDAAAQQHQLELLDTFSELDFQSASGIGAKLNPTNMKSLNAEDTEILSLCERMAKRLLQVRGNSDAGNFTSRGPGNFPATGEAVKTSAQFSLNPTFGPSFGAPSIPICFYLTPGNFRMSSPVPQMYLPPPPYYNFYGGMGSGFMGANMGVGPSSFGGFGMPQSFGAVGNAGGFFNPMSGAGAASGSPNNMANFFPKNVAPQTSKPQQFYCTYMQNGSNQGSSAGASGASATNPLSSAGFTNVNFKQRSANQTAGGVNIIYASYAGLPNQLDRKDKFKCQLAEQVACFGGNECILETAWCDSVVDCSDGSDEAACSCQDRLPDARLCDGYPDCPMGEDEIGCFGCDSFMYSCYADAAEYKRFNHSTVSMCYSALEKCDGISNCLNGRDELDCNILVNDVSHHMSHSVSTSEGFLYHNHGGQWYPVCNNAEQWATDACRVEGGYSDVPNITSREQSLPGPFIEPSIIGAAHFPQSCQKRNAQDALVDHATYVKCGAYKCGYRKKVAATSLRPKSKRSLKKLEKRIVVNRTINENNDEDDEAAALARIVGGRYSEPLEWPFVVAIYRNGAFHCGGSIYNERWIVSAAHCVMNFQKYYYEVRAGLLRRSSYSSATQTQPVSHVAVHQGYERRSMRNDLSLLRLAEPLRFNRWIKPICMPDVGRTTNGDDWIWGPDPDTFCTVVGWGAIREKGPGSDPLREVVIPIHNRCTEKMDQQSESVCAGEANGGLDACQGDSGGPLFCRSVANSEEWYLAGVVSHGNGCARPGEYGVYTRVALYLDWLELATKPSFLPQLQPNQICPGFVCVWGGKRCIPERKRCNRIVDCLGGEDEVGCVYNFIPDVGSAQNSSTTESDYFPESETTAVPLNLPQSQDFSQNEASSTAANLDVTTQGLIEEATVFSVNMFENIEVLENSSTIKPSTEATIRTTEDSLILSTSISTAKIETFTEILPTSTQDLPTISTISEKASDFKTTADIFQTAGTPSTTGTTTVEEFTETTTPTAKEATATTMKTKILPIQQLPDKFICQSIPQIIEKKHRCDRHVDCEDGTDEQGCRCIDYLKGSLDILVCDGKTDCEDTADEEDCGQCQPHEFQCPLSKTCIPMAKRCNNISDCKFREDEKDCFALTNGKELKLDINRQPAFSNVGIFTRNSNGVWQVVCSHETNYNAHSAKTVADICTLLGFRGFKFYNTTSAIPRDQIVVPIDPEITKKHRLRAHLAAATSDNLELSSNEHLFPIETLMSSRSERVHNAHSTCLGLYVECNAASNETEPLKTLSAGEKLLQNETSAQKLMPSVQTHARPNVFVKPELQKTHLVKKKEEVLDKLAPIIEQKTNSTILVDNQLYETVEELHWPWLVDVYANGKLWCAGVLLDKYWVLVHESCYFGVRLNTDYVAALFGGGKTKHTPHKSQNEQIRRIDCFQSVPNSDVILYHMERPVHFTHHILPTFLPDGPTANGSNSSNCMAILHDDATGRIKTVPIDDDVEEEHSEHCQANDMSCLRLMENKPPQCQSPHTDVSCEDMARVSHEVDFKTENENSKSFISSALTKFTTCKQFGRSSSSSRQSKEVLEPIDQGILVCRDEVSAWYPAALFSYNNTDCHSFKKAFGVRTLENAYQVIQQMIDQPKCNITHAQPYCDTYRCPLGKCLEKDEVCNGRNECHDGSDEVTTFCLRYKKECEPSEMKCRSSKKCVPKTKFCDHIPDCEDFTDEPTVCSCFTYLRATDPSKICDGIRNCWDKSDESPAICNCTSELFPCSPSSNECIPHDFVCDKEPDCPNGEDERYCFGIEQPLVHSLNKNDPLHSDSHKPPKYGQVIEQSYGIWHTKCFPRSSPPDISEIRQICKKLGYPPYRQPSYRLIDDEANEVVESSEPESDIRGRSFSNSSLAGKYRYSTKAVVTSKFSSLHLNDKLTLFIKPSRPIAELVRWNATDSSHCFRLEIRCA